MWRVPSTACPLCPSHTRLRARDHQAYTHAPARSTASYSTHDAPLIASSHPACTPCMHVLVQHLALCPMIHSFITLTRASVTVHQLVHPPLPNSFATVRPPVHPFPSSNPTAVFKPGIASMHALGCAYLTAQPPRRTPSDSCPHAAGT